MFKTMDIKQIPLPVKETSTTISLSSIHPYSKGIIIVLDKESYVGYISYEDGYWSFSDTMDYSEADTFMQECSLFDLIIRLSETYEQLSLKYIC